MLVFVKGKPKPALMENVARVAVESGALWIVFEDGSEVLIANGQWREADVEAMKPIAGLADKIDDQIV